MGGDNLFHNRKAKGARELARKKAKRAPYDKVLIVTEGDKTEPLYFTELKDYYEINSTNIKVDGGSGSSPIGVVNYGRKLYRRERDAGDPFDRVYCVFDKDTHSSYQQALSRVATLTPKNTFFVTHSVPCFEYWLLLHFIYTTAPFTSTGRNSAAQAVINRLKAYMPDYSKAKRGVFNSLLDRLEEAKANAMRSLAEAENNHTDNPSTRVHDLVIYLQNINSEHNG